MTRRKPLVASVVVRIGRRKPLELTFDETATSSGQRGWWCATCSMAPDSSWLEAVRVLQEAVIHAAIEADRHD